MGAKNLAWGQDYWEWGYWYVCTHGIIYHFLPSRELCVPFESGSDAKVAYQSLVVDPEPRRSGVTKVLRVESNTLLV